MLGSLIASSTALQENMIVECSRFLIVISSGDLDFSCFRVMHRMAGSHAAQYQNWSSGMHDAHPVRHVSPGTT